MDIELYKNVIDNIMVIKVMFNLTQSLIEKYVWNNENPAKGQAI